MRTYKHIFSLIQWNKYYIYFIKLYLVSCRFHFSILWNILPELSFNYANLIVNSEYNMLLKLQQPRKYVVGDRSSWVFGVKSEIWRTSGKSLRAQTSQTSACSLNIVDHSSAVYKTTNNRILTKRLPFWNKSKEVCISLQSCFSVQHFMCVCVCLFLLNTSHLTVRWWNPLGGGGLWWICDFIETDCARVPSDARLWFVPLAYI